MSDDLQGWTGGTIPLNMQAAVMVKYYEPAIDTILRSLAFLHKDMKATLQGAETGGYIDKLQEMPFFQECLASLVDNHEKFDDGMFRMSYNQLGGEAREELRDFVTYTCAMLWIRDGATFPEGMLEEAVAESDEEE